jgi:phenylacetic acid degradation operon negative regulatory protein
MESTKMPDGSQTNLMRLLGVVPPRAGHFIVSLYGDVVEPRGGTLWMGRVIDLCQAAGLSETLVRTAVSRLVAAGQLEGERLGRRSYYRLTPKAQVEFAHAARVLFTPPETPDDFALLAMPQTGLPHGFVAMRADLAFGPNRPDLAAEGQFVLRASVQQYGADLPDFVAGLWDLAPLSQSYQSVLTRFAPLLEPQSTLAPQDALIARLLLVDDYRAAILRDPMLPRAALPDNWPGWAARTLFVRLYLHLSQAADSYIQHAFEEHEGLHLSETAQMAARRGQLQAEAGGQTG